MECVDPAAVDERVIYETATITVAISVLIIAQSVFKLVYLTRDE